MRPSSLDKAIAALEIQLHNIQSEFDQQKLSYTAKTNAINAAIEAMKAQKTEKKSKTIRALGVA